MSLLIGSYSNLETNNIQRYSQRQKQFDLFNDFHSHTSFLEYQDMAGEEILHGMTTKKF